MTLAETPLARPEDLATALQAFHEAQKQPVHARLAPLALLRGGKPMSLAVRPEVKVFLAPAPEEAKAEFYLGTPVNPADATLKAHLGLNEDTGLVVGDVVEDSPASRAGVMKFDVLVSLGGSLLPSVEALRTRVQEIGGKPTQLDLIRGGQRRTVPITPEARKPEPQAATNNGRGLIYLYGDIDRDGNVDLMRTLNTNVDRLYLNAPQGHTIVNLDGPAQTTSGVFDFLPNLTASPDVARKLDELNAQVQALNKAVEELRKTIKPTAQEKK